MTANVDWLLQTDYWQPLNFALITAILGVAIFLRYLILAAIYHHIFYKKLGSLQRYRLLHSQIKMPQVRKEIFYSLVGAFIFAVAGAVMLILWQRGYTQIYLTLHVWDVLWVPISVFVAMFIHETYYYWLHRWMHKPKVLHLFHQTHHESVYTSSFTSFSFHPLEAIFQALFMPLLVLFLPIHVFVLVALLLIMSISAVINHAGVEVFPTSFAQSKIGKWFIGATHHDMHHLHYRYNYGLYFTFWDVWMDTEHKGYQKRFIQHTKQALQQGAKK